MLLRWWWRALLGGALVIAVSALLLFTPGGLQRILFARNFRSVVPGIYRSAQPTQRDLETWRVEPGIQSLLSLRRPKPGRTWYDDELAFVRAHDLEHETVALSGEHLPSPEELWRILRFLDHAPRPILLHCSAGVERTGLAAAVAVLLDGGTPERAREEFSRSRGFLEFLGISDLPHFVDRYAAWLEEEQHDSHPALFRLWAETVYAPYFYRAELALVGREGRALRVRVTNRSREVIPFRNAAPGVRLGAHWRPRGGAVQELRGETARLDLAPGASVDLAFPLPGASGAGRAGPGVLELDLVDEGRKWFAEMGSPTLALPLGTP